jgi:hypothetical protein
VVSVPIEMRDGVNLDVAGMASLRLQLSWRASMLYPQGTALKIIALRPNPVSSTAELDFVAEGGAEVRFRLIDAGGVERKVISAGTLEAGAYGVSLDVSDLPTGSYICLLESGGKSDNLSIIVRR